MAVNEKNVLMQKKKSNGDTEILYPVTTSDNVITNDEQQFICKTEKDKLKNMDTLKCKTVTLAVANWVQNTSTKNYEYTVTDSTVTASHKVAGVMDLVNQAKIKKGYTESFNGGYKMIVSEKPTQAVIVNFYIQKVVN